MGSLLCIEFLLRDVLRTIIIKNQIIIHKKRKGKTKGLKSIVRKNGGGSEETDKCHQGGRLEINMR